MAGERKAVGQQLLLAVKTWKSGKWPLFAVLRTVLWGLAHTRRSLQGL